MSNRLHAKHNRRHDCLFLSHSTLNVRWWMNLNMKLSNSCLLCYPVYDYNFFYSTSQLHMAHFYSISLHSVWHYLLLLALLAQTRDRSSARKRCLKTMLARWKEQVKWEKRKEEKRFKKIVWGFFFFFCSCPRLFNFIWDYWAWWV